MHGTISKLSTRYHLRDGANSILQILPLLSTRTFKLFSAGDLVETEGVQPRVRDQTVQSSQEPQPRCHFDRNSSRSFDAEARDRRERLHQRYVDRW